MKVKEWIPGKIGSPDDPMTPEQDLIAELKDEIAVLRVVNTELRKALAAVANVLMKEKE